LYGYCILAEKACIVYNLSTSPASVGRVGRNDEKYRLLVRQYYDQRLECWLNFWLNTDKVACKDAGKYHLSAKK